jgi:hypothetical protein
VKKTSRTHHQLQARFGEYEPLVHQAIQQLGRVLHNGHVGDLGRVFFWRGEVLATTHPPSATMKILRAASASASASASAGMIEHNDEATEEENGTGGRAWMRSRERSHGAEITHLVPRQEPSRALPSKTAPWIGVL